MVTLTGNNEPNWVTKLIGQDSHQQKHDDGAKSSASTTKNREYFVRFCPCGATATKPWSGNKGIIMNTLKMQHLDRSNRYRFRTRHLAGLQQWAQSSSTCGKEVILRLHGVAGYTPRLSPPNPNGSWIFHGFWGMHSFLPRYTTNPIVDGFIDCSRRLPYNHQEPHSTCTVKYAGRNESVAILVDWNVATSDWWQRDYTAQQRDPQSLPWVPTCTKPKGSRMQVVCMIEKQWRMRVHSVPKQSTNLTSC